MNRWVPNLYLKKGQQKSVPEPILEESLKQAHRVQNNGLPAILTLGHLAFQTGVSYIKLHELVSRNIDPYRTFSIKKRTGGWRRINVPEFGLLRVQKYIDRHILSKIPASPYSYAFESRNLIKKCLNKSNSPIADCATQHLGCRWLIKIDLRHFFESLSEMQVYRVFAEAGYNNLVSFELARLCTKVLSATAKKYSKANWKSGRPSWVDGNSYPRYSFYIDKYKRIGHLPQGAPTSPRLSNLIVRKLDIEIAKVVDSYGLTYTRYADDMTFSTGSNSFSKKQGCDFINKIYSLLPKHGLRPHPQKAQIVPPGARKIVLGLLVDGDNVRLTKQFRSNLECHLYYCVKDPISHSTNRGFASVLGLKNYINGLLAYAKQVDSDYVKKIRLDIGKPEWPI